VGYLPSKKEKKIVSLEGQNAAMLVSLKLRKLLCTRQELYHPMQEVSLLELRNLLRKKSGGLFE